MQTARVLVVEDDQVINQALSDRLRAEGFTVFSAYDGPGGVAAQTQHTADVVILDLMLPGFDGLEVCRRIQASAPVPVLMLTARDAETDILTGLAVGADDYLVKPFRMREVVARVRALLRRVERAKSLVAGAEPTTVGDLTIDEASRCVALAGEPRHLTPTEFDILLTLAQRPGAVVTRDQLMQAVWGWSGHSGVRTIDSHMRGLRSKIGADRVRTVHGVGYALEVAR